MCMFTSPPCQQNLRKDLEDRATGVLDMSDHPRVLRLQKCLPEGEGSTGWARKALQGEAIGPASEPHSCHHQPQARATACRCSQKDKDEIQMRCQVCAGQGTWSKPAQGLGLPPGPPRLPRSPSLWLPRPPAQQEPPCGHRGCYYPHLVSAPVPITTNWASFSTVEFFTLANCL